ncbi:O51E1 protein, partial [Atractosteus spatula]|nr:O51E1 protein [Atractosteus spatula]
MQNTSYMTIFFLTAYDNSGSIRYLYFTATLLAFLSILFANVILITVIIRERKLHEPMYIFICSLSLNGLYGSCAFYPKCMANILSDTPSISRIACYIQIFCIHFYVGFEYLILALMAYDRYVSICHPLRYNSIMTPSKVTQLLVFIYMWSLCIFSVLISLTIRLPLCGSVIQKVYCDNWSVVRHSCVDVSVNSGYGLFATTVFVGSSFLLVSYSYLRILLVCKKASKEAQAKALQTCTPHLLTFMNYSLITCFELVYQRFDVSKIPNVVRVVVSIDFLLLPPLLNPIIYGIKLQEVRKRIIKMFHSIKINSVVGFQDRRIKYLYFVISLLLYLIIIVLNVALITLIYRDKSLREPMYLFLCSLAANGLYGSTGLFPALCANFLSRTHDISRVFCFAQIFILHTYGCCEFTSFETCAPHLLNFMNYCIATCFEVIHQRFDLRIFSNVLHIIISINCFVSPPLFNPIIYGIKLREIRKRIIKMFFCIRIKTVVGVTKPYHKITNLSSTKAVLQPIKSRKDT